MEGRKERGREGRRERWREEGKKDYYGTTASQIKVKRFD